MIIRVRSVRALAFAMALVTLPTSTSPQSTVREIELNTPPFSERVNPEVKTAGARVLGFQGGAPLAGVAGDWLTVSGLRASDADICVAIEKVDGSYSAAFQVRNPRSGPTIRFHLPSKLIARLRPNNASLAILARAGANGCLRTDPILPATWGRQALGGPMLALVNGHQASVTRATLGGSKLSQCTRLSEILSNGAALKRFDMMCTLEARGACAADLPLTVQAIGTNGQDSISVTVRRYC